MRLCRCWVAMSSAMAWGVKDWYACSGFLPVVKYCGGREEDESEAEEEDEVLGDLVSR